MPAQLSVPDEPKTLPLLLGTRLCFLPAEAFRNFLEIFSRNFSDWLLQEGCSEIILATDKPFRRLDHFKMHEYSRRSGLAMPAPSLMLSAAKELVSAPSGSPSGPPVHVASNPPHSAAGSTPLSIGSSTGSPSFSLDSMFRRKRGRPPKNRVIEVWNESVSCSKTFRRNFTNEELFVRMSSLRTRTVAEWTCRRPFSPVSSCPSPALRL